MNILGRWRAEKVLKELDENLKPSYMSAEDALKTENYSDYQSQKFIKAIYEFTDNKINVLINDEELFRDEIKNKGYKEVEKGIYLSETIDALYEDGKYYLLDTQSEENGVIPRHELKIDEDGLIDFMMIMKIKKID